MKPVTVKVNQVESKNFGITIVHLIHQSNSFVILQVCTKEKYAEVMAIGSTRLIIKNKENIDQPTEITFHDLPFMDCHIVYTVARSFIHVVLYDLELENQNNKPLYP